MKPINYAGCDGFHYRSTHPTLTHLTGYRSIHPTLAHLAGCVAFAQ
ncbi:MAG: hypothetical protein LUO95_10580 [Methylococcaceae bacterium]|nr:hypothetical protein [Methylococcaceae bacterium]MDD1617302.1 hypothetical protein [Methylococcaceae bacterium]